MVQIGPWGIFGIGCLVGAVAVALLVVVAAVILDKKGK